MRQVTTLVHPIATVWRADVGRHQVLLLQLVVEAGDAEEDDVTQVKVSLVGPTNSLYPS